MLNVTYRTWHGWESGSVQVPYAAFKLFRIFTRFDLPGKAWSGWKLSGDALISPEGKNFTAADLGYLYLVFAMARQWRIERQEKRASGLRPKTSNLVPFVRPKKGGKKNSSIG